MSTIQIPVRSPVGFHIPSELAGLYELAHNLWWTWRPDAQRLFSMIHRWAWSRYQTPVEVLLAVEKAEWEHLLQDATFMADYAAVDRDFREYLRNRDGGWFNQRYPGSQVSQGSVGSLGAPVAYFSTEYGLHQCLALYSGGLGVLSADHLKSASDLGVPFVAVGLAYRLGYFRQSIDADGVQQHTYPENDFVRLGLRPVAGPSGDDLIVHVPFPEREVAAKVWALIVGRVPLLLLDTDTLLNDPADRPITNQLYTRGREMRFAQELVLGVGGVRALRALGIAPSVWHLNEGHSSLLQLERLRRKVAEGGKNFGAALAEIRANTAFTTHTPVVAGHETFEPALATYYLGPWADRLSVPTSLLFSLAKDGDVKAEAGRAGAGSDADEHDVHHTSRQESTRDTQGTPEDPADKASQSTQPFNLTAIAFRTSSFVNGVSVLNATVSDAAWRHLRPDVPGGETVVHPITNGVHLPTWLGGDIRSVLTRSLGADWLKSVADDRDGSAKAIPMAGLWQAHVEQKKRLVRFTRERLRRQYARHGRSPERLRAVEDLFDAEPLTIGFARRFATYKRANLVFSDLERIRDLLRSAERPVQVILAGKAHPADRPGQELIRQVFALSQDESLLGHVFFLENYDLQVAQMLIQGVDVWLNTPRKPQEASGTSGMKAAVNGVLNCSILDGWWPEAYDGTNGWAIDGGEHEDEAAQDRADAESLYRLLEQEIVPMFYQRDEESGLPADWIARMIRSIVTIAEPFSSDRMVRDYVTKAYAPLSGLGTSAAESQGAVAGLAVGAADSTSSIADRAPG